MRTRQGVLRFGEFPLSEAPLILRLITAWRQATGTGRGAAARKRPWAGDQRRRRRAGAHRRAGGGRQLWKAATRLPRPLRLSGSVSGFPPSRRNYPSEKSPPLCFPPPGCLPAGDAARRAAGFCAMSCTEPPPLSVKRALQLAGAQAALWEPQVPNGDLGLGCDLEGRLGARNR